MNNLACEKLAEIIKKYSVAVCDDPKKVEGLLWDLCGGAALEVRVLVSCLKAGVAEKLRSPQNGVPLEILLGQLTGGMGKWMSSQHDARWGVETWAVALGKLRPAELGGMAQQGRDGQAGKTQAAPVPGGVSVTADLRVGQVGLRQDAAGGPVAAHGRGVSAASAPSGMALIPAGSFTMGNTFSGEGCADELPQHSVYVSAFYLDKYAVTKALWDEVYTWAVRHGYSFEYGAEGKAASHPAQRMTWYDAVKWCNARSEKESKVPAYYTDAGLSERYRGGQVDVQNTWVKWSRGYRLPTEAEWEKAARGGASGCRFPGSGTDNITHSLANYESSAAAAYDTSPTRGFHPNFQAGGKPFTSPVDYFAPNGYGLYDMAGNVWQWCWDWYGAYSGSAQSDPRGPATGSYRMYRGGSWSYYAVYCRAAARYGSSPTDRYNDFVGFRSVLPLGQ